MDIVCPQLPCSSGFFNLKITMQTQITFCLCMHQHHRIPFWKTCQLNCLLTLLEFSLTKICHRQIKFLQWFDIFDINFRILLIALILMFLSLEMVFCYQNCYALIWEKNILVIKKNFSRILRSIEQFVWTVKV